MTKFADMPQGSLNGWLLWCQSHEWGTLPDWYEPAKGSGCYPWFDDMTGELVTYSIEANGAEAVITEARHKTPRELKAWAGY